MVTLFGEKTATEWSFTKLRLWVCQTIQSKKVPNRLSVQKQHEIPDDALHLHQNIAAANSADRQLALLMHCVSLP